MLPPQTRPHCHFVARRAALVVLMSGLGLGSGLVIAADPPVTVAPVSGSVSGPVSQDMSSRPAGPSCPAEPATADKEALKRELTALAGRARREVEGSDAALAIKATIAGRMMSLGDAHFGCQLNRELLRSGPSAATMELLRCQQRRYCGAPAVVTCPGGTVAREVHGCEAAQRCSVVGWQAQADRCHAQGDPACCSSGLIVREYELLAAGVAALPRHRAELRALAEAACEVGVAQACTQAVTLIDRPAGAEGEAKMVALRQRACSLGRLEACKPASPAEVEAQR